VSSNIQEEWSPHTGISLVEHVPILCDSNRFEILESETPYDKSPLVSTFIMAISSTLWRPNVIRVIRTDSERYLDSKFLNGQKALQHRQPEMDFSGGKSGIGLHAMAL